VHAGARVEQEIAQRAALDEFLSHDLLLTHSWHGCCSPAAECI
jgi:hypothetical protein